MSSRSRSTSGLGYKMCEMSPFSALHHASLLYGVRNARTCCDVQSVVLVSTNAISNEAFYKKCFAKHSRIKLVTHLTV